MTVGLLIKLTRILFVKKDRIGVKSAQHPVNTSIHQLTDVKGVNIIFGYFAIDLTKQVNAFDNFEILFIWRRLRSQRG